MPNKGKINWEKDDILCIIFISKVAMGNTKEVGNLIGPRESPRPPADSRTVSEVRGHVMPQWDAISLHGRPYQWRVLYSTRESWKKSI